MLKNIEITKKVPMIMITFALLSALVTGMTAYAKLAESMDHAAKDKLNSLLASRKSSLQHYFDNIIRQVTFQATSPLIVNAVQAFDSGWKELGYDPKNQLQQQYIHDNPFDKSNRNKLLTPLTYSHYNAAHRFHHPFLNSIVDINGYYDLILISPAGKLIYSVEKENDFATNLISGRWKDTGLANLFKRINTNRSNSKIMFTDFTPYPPSNSEPASFIGTAIISNGKYLGAFIVQLPIEPLDEIMQVTAGMGETGETYVVGSDLLMRSNSRFLTEPSILKTKVNTQSVHTALKGHSGFAIIDDYRGVPVYSSFSPIEILSVRWAIMAEIDEAEVLAPLTQMSQFLFISGLLIATVISILGYLISSDISRPIVSMTKTMNRLSNNDLTVDILGSDRTDEIGKMADAMIIFKANAIERQSLQQAMVKIIDNDALTGLFNRKFAMEKLNQLTQTTNQAQSKIVLMFIDLDNFKQMNDVHGHHEGDQTLCAIANHLKSCVRKDDIVARIGGDEFIIIFPNVLDVTMVSPIAEKLVSDLPKLKTDITLSIGLSVFPDDTTDPKVLLKLADTAMYKVKKSGKNQFAHWNTSLNHG